MNAHSCNSLSIISSINYIIDVEGIRATPEKVAAITNAPLPKNMQQLLSFLGLLNYCWKFLPNLASIAQPLNELPSFLSQKNKKVALDSKYTQAVKNHQKSFDGI